MMVCIDFNMNCLIFLGFDFVLVVNFDFLKKVYDVGIEKGLYVCVGNVLIVDVFYCESMDIVKKFGDYGVLVVEMEIIVFYILVVKYGVNVLFVLIVSDYIFIGEEIIFEEC